MAVLFLGTFLFKFMRFFMKKVAGFYPHRVVACVARQVPLPDPPIWPVSRSKTPFGLPWLSLDDTATRLRIELRCSPHPSRPGAVMILVLGVWAFVRALLVNSATVRSEEHTSELQSRPHLVCRLL